MTVLVFRREDDQFALHISSIELFFEPEAEYIHSDGVKYKGHIIHYFNFELIETILCHDLREEEL